MFQNSYQNGTYFDLFDPKIPIDKCPTLYKIIQPHNSHSSHKIFDKQLKTYIFQFCSQFSKLSFPKQDKRDLYLIQQYLVLQVCISDIKNWHIELTISDIHKTKRRLILTNSISKIEKKAFFIKYPFGTIKENVWTNLVIDLYSFIGVFKDLVYRSLDSIHITGNFKLRRIFTTQQLPSEFLHEQKEELPVNLIPKNFHLPETVHHDTQLLVYNQQQNFEDLLPHHETQKRMIPRSRGKRQQISSPKTDTQKSESRTGHRRQKKSLAVNMSTEQEKKTIKKQMQDSSHEKRMGKGKKSESASKHETRKESVEKKKSEHSRTQKLYKKGDTKSTVDKNMKRPPKLNPWRSARSKQVQTDQDNQSPNETSRQINSADMTMFKTKNNLAKKLAETRNKGFDIKSDNYSDSEYAEMSQKFSTVSDGKFFKSGFISQTLQEKSDSPREDPEQIQQKIETESNSMMESVLKREVEEKNNYVQSFKMGQSEVDSLDKLNMKASKQKYMSKMANISYYGFGEKAMKKVLGDAERPYSPPIGQRESTEMISERNEQEEQRQVQVIYDPILNCYYDHKTHTYYEMKNP